MTARHLDRRAKLAVLLVALIFLVIVAISVRGCVSMMLPKSIMAESSRGEDRIIQVGRQTIFLEEGSVASRISQWLNDGAADARAFDIEDQLFNEGSDDLTDEGMVRLQRFADLVKENGLRAKLFVTTYEGADAAQKQELAGRRAERILGEMVGRGVPEAQISTAVERISPGTGAAPKTPPTMVLVLSKKAAA